MNVRKQLTIGLALAGLALGLTTVQANAEPVLKGTFELPAAAYWGDTLLQPGQYTIWMSMEMRDIARVPTIHLSGEGINATFLAIAKPARESGRNFLDIANIDGTYVIRAFDAGTIGESFAFGVTKSVKSKALRASAEPAIALPVSAE
ncbi:MAG TPA: hypothetical protein VN924_15485 [Bryobacteraceae bacterium]|jgi:hypothetical protein|nr:hypothetical protein [Bryobacteraceae bacterium]